ncbi:MAG: carbohydrate kinase family protein [Nocardioidaceae bacterium]
MLVCCLGDAVLDVVVTVADGLAQDDDVPARVELRPGGQAANVAAWVCRAGGRARFLGPRSDTVAGALLAQTMAGHGIEPSGPSYPSRPGAVVSVSSGGRRSMASDEGALGWPTEVFETADLTDADWLLLSGYVLYRTPHLAALVALTDRARLAGVPVGVDLASARLLTEFGARRVADLLDRLGPGAVFANEAEWEALAWSAPYSCDLVLKQGDRGCTFHHRGDVRRLPAVAADVRDTTGAGDALAAGYLVGGPPLAMRLAAECVAQPGAQPGREMIGSTDLRGADRD